MTVDREESVAARARRLLDAGITPGPWFIENHGIMDKYRGRTIVIFGDSTQDDADAELIASCPELVRSLLAERDELEAGVQEAFRLGEAALVGVLEQRDEAVELLREFADEYESMMAYVEDYFLEKWGYRESPAKVRDFLARLGEQEGTNP